MTNPWGQFEDAQPGPWQTPSAEPGSTPAAPQPNPPQYGSYAQPEGPYAQPAPAYPEPNPGQQAFSTYPPPPYAPYQTSEPGGMAGTDAYGQHGGQMVPSGYGCSYPPTQPEHPNAVAALVLGIVGFFSGIAWPIAWYLGSKGRSDMRQQPLRWRHSPMLTAGWVLGIVGTSLMALLILLFVLIIVAAAAFSF